VNECWQSDTVLHVIVDSSVGQKPTVVHMVAEMGFIGGARLICNSKSAVTMI
jgi:hypothetical protein